MFVDLFVHERLGHGGCVLLIMAEFAETDDVDDDVALNQPWELVHSLKMALVIRSESP